MPYKETAPGTKKLHEHQPRDIQDPYVIANRFFNLRFRRRIPLAAEHLELLETAYRKAMKRFHPDIAVAKGAPKEEAEADAVHIQAAYQTLKDAQKKSLFDANLITLHGTPTSRTRVTHKDG